MSRTQKIALMALILSSVVCFGVMSAAFAQTNEPNGASVAFEKLKTLSGRWEADTIIGTATATYEVVSGGKAVIEHIGIQGKHDMITVYYVDHDRLLLTHYCDSGNQPRMQASGINTKTNSIDFHFVDITNLPSADAMHMHDVVINFTGPNEIAEHWTMFQDGKSGRTETFNYHRVNQKMDAGL
jgi:hypothetical protein